ncbi:hypothetical protein ATORI0001_1400 [Lancefieldella rimae ATCC 49626]|uniref:Uncharacterized protein n=1 Tax=Lancefieldella rimae (strain ATCC 49626 / DSM 7090 / CCUG 31168 / NBRC 15546 / VPI D140H-11A) TaxID=553184 RepID=B9CM61_LANR4|nr:hypothetical protein ATORI0001_1400 [Lancefieldella rimae ATCC 49626]
MHAACFHHSVVCWRKHEEVSQIAQKMGRDKSTGSRELARNEWNILTVSRKYTGLPQHRQKQMQDTSAAGGTSS